MFNSTGTVLRGDLNAVVEEANAADRFFIGEQLFPPMMVDKKDGQYPKLTKTLTGLVNIGTTTRRPGSGYGRVDRQWTTDTYTTYDRGIEEPVDDSTANELAGFFNAEAVSARLCLRQVKLDHEYRVMEEVVGTNAATNWGAGTNSAVAYTLANIATIDFGTDVRAAVERCINNGVVPNTIVLSSTVLQRLKQATLLLNELRGVSPVTQRNPVSAGTIQQLFADDGITQVLIGRARYNGAKKGQTFSASSVWGTTYVWVGSVQAGMPKEGQDPGAGRTLVWNKEGGIWVTESYREEGVRSNIVRVRQHTTEKVIDGSAGTLITTQWS